MQIENFDAVMLDPETRIDHSGVLSLKGKILISSFKLVKILTSSYTLDSALLIKCLTL